MPFTPSHVAAVLPFVRTPLPPAVLAIGAMMPDLFYYAPIDIPRGFTHSWLGVVTVDLVFALLLFVLWKAVFRAPVLDVAPRWVRERMGSAEWMPTRRASQLAFVALLVAAVLIGSTTHVLWDSLTHAGPTVDALGLGAMLGPLPLYKWGQHASSMLGVVVIVVFVVWWRRTTAPHSPAPTRLSPRLRVAAVSVVAATGLAAAVTVWVRGIAAGSSPIENQLIFYTVTIGIAAAGLASVVLCFVWWLRGR